MFAVGKPRSARFGGAFSAPLAKGAFWVGLGAFESLCFCSTIASDGRLYGAIGVIFM